MSDSLSYRELLDIYAEAKEIYNSGISWKAKYDLIFSDRISKRVRFDYYDPDTSYPAVMTTYEEDVTAFVMAFHDYMTNGYPNP